MRIYVAGSYSANNVMQVLENMRAGIRAATEVLLAGFAPFCPWLDYQYKFALRETETLTIDDFYQYSLSWLKVSEAMLVIEGWEKSRGTLHEIEVAKKLGIPIFYSLLELKKYYGLV